MIMYIYIYIDMCESLILCASWIFTDLDGAAIAHRS